MESTETPLERWNARFASDDYHFGKEPSRFIKVHAHYLKPGQSVLAIADGEGRNGVWLAEQGLRVHSIDFSPLALDKARKLAAERKVELTIEQADLSSWSWPTRRFDAVVAIFIQFADPALRRAVFTGIKQCLKPGGRFLLHGYRPKQLDYKTGGPPQVENLYTEEMLRDAFADMRILELTSYDTEIREGVGHAGMSALIDLVTEKV
jgi:cyclopropane fatty-acyl-phospholipid synthase-like methyltransferase